MLEHRGSGAPRLTVRTLAQFGPGPVKASNHQYARWGTIVGLGVSVVVLLVTWALYLSGEHRSGRLLGAQGAAFLLASVGSVPLGFVLAPLAQHLTGVAAWGAIVLMPVLNGMVCGAGIDLLLRLRR